jgi:hypothetical protein
MLRRTLISVDIRHDIGVVKYIETVTCRGDIRDGWIYCILYIHNSGLLAIQRYRCSAHFTVHRCTRTTVLSLH